MTTKKKFWWALGSLALVLVVAATSVGITIAALQAQVNSSFSISYTAKNVKAGIIGAYGTPSMTSAYSLTSEIHFLQNDETVPLGDYNALLFTGSETSNTKAFDDPGKIEIPTRKVAGLNNFVLFCYIFMNFDQAPLSTSLNFQKTSDDANIQVEYASADFADMYAIMNGDDYSSLGAEVQQKIEADLEKINTFLGNKGLDGSLTLFSILCMISFKSFTYYDEELEAIKQDPETLSTLIDLVNTYENALNYSQDFSTFEVPFCGYSLEQLMSGAVSDITEVDATCLFIKISLKNETVNVDNFGAEINFSLTPSTAA